MDNALTVRAEAQVVNYEDYAMTPERIVKQVELIQEVMKSVMREGEHYGKIPGCGDKPTLLKPGAEKLSTTFRLAPSYDIQEKSLSNGHREYRLTCTLTHIPTGAVFGQGVGSASTMESKYRYRKAERICPKCGKEAIITGKAEYGGGFVCFKKKGGCGEKFKTDDPAITNQPAGKTEYEDPADYYNTILKMAKKRAHVDATLTCTAASDLFTQDVEDLPPHLLKKNEPVIDAIVEEVLPEPPVSTDAEMPESMKSKQDDKPKISDPQRKRFYAIAKSTGFTDEEIKSHLKTYGIEHTKDILKSEYEELCKWAQGEAREPGSDDK